MPSRSRCLLIISAAACLTLLGLGGCPPATPPGGATQTPNATGADNGVQTEPNATPVGLTSNPGDEQVPPGDDGTKPTGPLSIRGRLNPGHAAKHYPRMQGATLNDPYTIVVTSDQTGKVYEGETNSDGNFDIAIPDSEAGHALVVTLVGPDGHALGPVLVDSAGEDGVTGVAMDQPADLGTVNVPDDPAKQAILAGTDGNAGQLADPNTYARLNAEGAPVGVSTVGKGTAAEIDPNAVSGAADRDHDGLVDFLDADSDGSGVLDDLKPNAQLGKFPPDCSANFFMNLKVGPEDAQTYYAGAADSVATRLKTDTVITLETCTNNVAKRALTSVRLLETPGPEYLPQADFNTGTPQFTNWKAAGYAFANLGNPAPGFGPRWGVWMRPNAVIQAGDIFTAELTFDTGEVATFTRMINYVFKSIPRLVRVGASGNLQTFDVTNPSQNGSGGQPILFDGTQDLVLVFNPPKDETGAYLTGFDYNFEIFFMGQFGGQLNIDHAATWTTPIPGLNPPSWYGVKAAQLGALASDGTYTVTLPIGVLPSTVHVQGGGVENVAAYKIDIAAECPSGNAAIMLNYKKN